MPVKRGFCFFIFISLIYFFNSSPSGYAEPVKKPYAGTITIGLAIWPGYFPLLVARDKGYFTKEGLNVEIKVYVGLADLSKDYTAGKMQGRANLTLDAINESIAGLDHKVVLAIDYSNGSDAIMATQAIQSIQDFKGKKVGYELNTLEEFFLTWALAENGMSLSDVVSINANPEESAKQLKAGQVDAAVTYEPFMSQFLSPQDFHPVYSSKDAPGLISDILTFRTDFIQTHPETMEALIRAYFKGVRFWKEHPEEANAITAKEYKDTPESIAHQLEGIKILDEKDNMIAFTFAAGLRSLYGNLRQIEKFIRKSQGGKKASLDTDKLIDRTFIKKITQD